MRRGAIVGLGNVALNGHLPAWQKSSAFQIVAGLDCEPARRELFSRTLPETICTDSFAKLPPGLDFVDICTPPNTHFELIKDALERGWHVLCEKPLVLASWQLDQICELATLQRRVVLTVHNWKFAPICRKIAELVRSGALGQIDHCAWHVLRHGPSVTTDRANWRLDPEKAGGGILVDHGWHAFYLIREWMGTEPSAVQASLDKRKYAELDVEDTATVTLRFARTKAPPATASIFLTWASPLRQNSGWIEGSLARLTIENDSLSLAHHDGQHEEFHFDGGLSSGSHHPDWFEAVTAEFAGELDDVSRRGTNLKVARLCLRLIEQAKASSRAQEFLPV